MATWLRWMRRGSSKRRHQIPQTDNRPLLLRSQDAPTNAAEVKALLEAKLAPAGQPKRAPKVSAPQAEPKPVVGGSPLTQLRERVSRCDSCNLSRSRSQVVFGEGRADAPLMFVGDGPGRDEDRQGEPFLGDVGTS